MTKRKHRIPAIKKLALFGSIALVSSFVYADEGGAGFWLPGTHGSLVAMQTEPGWSMPIVYYYSSVDASASEPLPIGGEIRIGLNSDTDIFLVDPGYVFSDPVLGGQASIRMSVVLGHVDTTVDATLTEPNGDVLSGRLNAAGFHRVD